MNPLTTKPVLEKSPLALPVRKSRGESGTAIGDDLSAPAASMDGPSTHGRKAAPASQDLTVFSDYTEPPVSTSQPDDDGLADGGLSALYSKFRASVSASKEPDDNSGPTSASAAATAAAAAAAASATPGHSSTSVGGGGKMSRVQSPKTAALDSGIKMELPMPKASTKAAKLSLPSPGLRSPNAGLAPSNLAEPTLTTFQATMNNKAHSKTGSSQDPDEPLSHEPPALASGDELSLRRVLSQADQQGRFSRQERRLHSPQPPLARLDTKIGGHARGPSEVSNHDQKPKPTVRHHSTPQSATRDDPLRSAASVRPSSPDDGRLSSNPLDLLEPYDVGAQSMNGDRSAMHPDQRPTSPVPRSRSTTSKPVNKVSHSKLPGFQPSRASSTDSARTSRTPANAEPHGADIDGPGQILLKQSSLPSNRLRGRLLKKEFWMRDENARDCFRCGEPFTMMRRKHHCRTCGQIFDNKCTTLISGAHFDMPSAVRVCKPCELTITAQDNDDSSDYSDDPANFDQSARSQTPDFSAARYDDDNVSLVSQNLEHITRTPVINFPVRRAYDKSNRSSAILEFDAADHTLQRPSSSRSLRSAHQLGHGHKRHHSKHSHIRSLKPYHEDRVPFQRQTLEDLRGHKPSAFHRDSVIDPELAQYLSDDATSDEDPPLRPSHSADKLSRSGPDSDRTTIGGLLAAVRKGRSRMGDRSIASFLTFGGRDADDAASIVSARAIDGGRSSRRRNLSVASSVHHKLTPRATKERLQIVLPPGADPDSPASPVMRGSRMMRSASMHGIGAPHLELNRASVLHVHKMLRQLLKDADVPRTSSWEDALVPILLKVTDEVDPDVQGGDDIDIRSYVKLKKIPGGKPSDTSYVSGLIFTKNVALKSMQRTITRPRILIITFPLEYARSEAHFMSLDPVIRQEREYLQNIVSRIAALKPDVLFAQRNISGLALELLEQANISVVYNVKPSVLEAVSRCTQAAIHHSIDRLTSPAAYLGICELFEVKTYLADGRRKTFIYLSGCPHELGCTIALRGASRQILEKIKRITDFMIYVVYNLKLETCLMRDEWALIPTTDDLVRTPSSAVSKASKQQEWPEASRTRPPQSHTLSQLPATEATSHPNDHATEAADAQRVDSNDVNDIPEDIPVPTFYQDLADKHETRILSASPFVKFSQPYLLMRAREMERRVAYLKRLRDQDLSDSISSEEKAKAQKFTLITPEMVHKPPEGAGTKVKEIIHAVHDAEYEKALHYYETQKRGWESHLADNRNLFDPYAHQNIVVLFSTVSTDTNVPCTGPNIVAFSFYNEHENEQGFEADCTLGQYVEDLVYRAHDQCPLETCEKRLHEHQRQYVHGEAQITVFLEPHPPKLRGLQEVILMWSICKICGTETTVAPMSSSTWKYSFGKYLELSIWSADLHPRAGGCQHDLHRNHLRFFGYKGWALRIHYDAIDLLEVIVPRTRVTWKVDNDLRFRNDVFTGLEHRITRFMVSVKLRLKSINIEALLPETADACRNEVDRLMKQANEDHSTLIKKLQELYNNSRHWEIIPLNRAMRALQLVVVEWEQAFADFEKNFFPSEKDIRRLAALQLRKIFLDRDVSVTTLATDDETPSHSTDTGESKELSPESPGVTHKLSPEKTQDVLQSVMEEHAGSHPQAADEKQQDEDATLPPATPPLQPTSSNSDNVQRAAIDLVHLDLAVPGSTPKSNAGAVVPQSELSPKEIMPVSPEAAVHQAPKDAPEPACNSGVATSGEDSQASAVETTKSALSSRSQLPTPSQLSSHRRNLSRPGSPALLRAQSQPIGSLPLRKDLAQSQKQSTVSAINAMNGFGSATESRGNEAGQEPFEKRLSEKLKLSHLKTHKFRGQSLIPRAITSGRKDSRVSSLAKHFEQLTREFEQARLREKQQRASRARRPQIYPTSAPMATVQVYKNTDEAVDEIGEAGETSDYSGIKAGDSSTSTMAQAMAHTAHSILNTDLDLSKSLVDTPAEMTESDELAQQSSQVPSETEDRTDIEGYEAEDDEDDPIILPDSPEDLMRLSQEDMGLAHLPKHERTSLIKMLTNFWAERSSSGWSALDYPLGPSDHIYTDSDIIVREDELSSIIAFALDSENYAKSLKDINERSKALHHKTSEKNAEAAILEEDDISQALLSKANDHLKFTFASGPVKVLCKIFFAQQFDAMRKKCGVAERFVESMSRCMKFDSRGGKSKSLFLKTLDDRFVLKSLSQVEMQSFARFAPNYFNIISETFYHELPSVIARMFGCFNIIVKNSITGVESNFCLLVMENLFYDRTPTRIFDLKGSMRNRKINATGERNEVLLDENMVDFIYESPLFVREHSKKLLRSSVHNDTLFLAHNLIMDYSLMIAIDEPKRELVVGIIDCIRTYTWDKKLESWIKDRGFINAVAGMGSGVSGAKNRPTITSPRDYKRRFRQAMNQYVLVAPSCWQELSSLKSLMGYEARVVRALRDSEERRDELQNIS